MIDFDRQIHGRRDIDGVAFLSARISARIETEETEWRLAKSKRIATSWLR